MADKFKDFQNDLIEAGYTRMNVGSNSDPLFSSPQAGRCAKAAAAFQDPAVSS